LAAEAEAAGAAEVAVPTALVGAATPPSPVPAPAPRPFLPPTEADAGTVSSGGHARHGVGEERVPDDGEEQESVPTL
jgi:hypothetical protein